MPLLNLRAAAWRACRLPGFRQAGLAAYRLGLADFTRLARGIPGMRTVAVHHGTPGDPWVPGMSDIDLALSVEDAGPAFLDLFWPAYRNLRRRWPFLQEAIVMTPQEWARMSADPIASYEVARCEAVWGENLPEPRRAWDPRPALFRALSAWTEKAAAVIGRAERDPFQDAFDRRMLGKIAKLARPGRRDAADAPKEPVERLGWTLGLLEDACREHLESAGPPPPPLAKGEEGRGVVLPAGAEAAARALRGGQRARAALEEAGAVPPSCRSVLCSFDPLRNGFMRVVLLTAVPDPAFVRRLSDAIRRQGGSPPLSAEPLVVGPWTWRFLCEVRDPLLWASAVRDSVLLHGVPSPPAPCLRADRIEAWLQWETARAPYVLRLLGSDPEGLYPGYLEHRWRTALAVRLCRIRRALAPQHEELVGAMRQEAHDLLAPYLAFERDPGRGWGPALAHLQKALSLVRL